MMLDVPTWLWIGLRALAALLLMGLGLSVALQKRTAAPKAGRAGCQLGRGVQESRHAGASAREN